MTLSVHGGVLLRYMATSVHMMTTLVHNFRRYHFGTFDSRLLFGYIVLDHFGAYQTCNLSTRDLIEFITIPGGLNALLGCNLLFVMDPKINST